jgi:hypothetical protein
LGSCGDRNTDWLGVVVAEYSIFIRPDPWTPAAGYCVGKGKGASMSSSSEPVHLNNHHRNTLRQLFQHPAGHNIEWHAVVSLLAAVGTVDERKDGKLAVTVGSETEFLDPPADKDIDTQTVVDLRRMLDSAGYGIGGGDIDAPEQKD